MSRPPKMLIDLRENFPHLRHAPIVEGVIHWRAKVQSALQPERVKRRLVDLLPDYPESQPLHEFEVGAEVGGGGKPVTHVHGPKWTGFRFFSPDRLYIAQFTSEGLVFSRLQPYSNWEIFSHEAKRLWRIFLDVFEPIIVQRLGVRFINRIVPVDLSELEKLLQCPPVCLARIGLPMTSFMLQAMHEVPSHPYQVQVTQAIQPPSPPVTTDFGLIIDIDVSTTAELGLDSDVLELRLAEMRWLKNKTFFSVMTSSAIDSFNGEADE